MSWEPYVFVLALALSATFSSIEAAFLSVRRSWVRQLVASREPGADLVAAYADHPGRLLPVVLVGNNIVNTLAATVAALFVTELIPSRGIAALSSTVGVAVVLIVLGENIPKFFGATYAGRVVRLTALPVRMVELALLPLALPLQAMNQWMLRVLDPRRHDLGLEEEMKVLVALGQETGGLQEAEADFLLSSLHSLNATVADVMTPWDAVVSVPGTMSVRDFLEFNRMQSVSKLPIVDGRKVVGVLDVADVVRLVGGGADRLETTVDALGDQPLSFAPELSLVAAVREMRAGDRLVAVVTGADGSATGWVTLNQIVNRILSAAKTTPPPDGTEPT